MESLNISVESLLQDLIRIAGEASEAILEVYESPDFEVRIKSDDSPLTIADEKSNNIIVSALKQSYPDIPIISEESRQMEYEERKDFELFFLVDPLDGTKEFIKRNGEFTVNIALCRNHKVIAGVVLVPASNEVYYAAEGFGAYKGPFEDRKRLRAAPFHRGDEGLVVAISRSHPSEAVRKFIDALDNPSTLATGSSLKFLKLAEGKAHLYPRLGPTMEWDTAAAQIILEEAGGSVLTWEGNAPLKYNKEDLLNPYFIAKGAASHA
ncbi:MAG: 3'(2'),5'-bisphosphate nucleotidase CysQ [Saprospiraceae bacterium]|nr:3'(2'),5'-bisphosphate nucleotidase CysQ [Saprospiraceae bacterium]